MSALFHWMRTQNAIEVGLLTGACVAGVLGAVTGLVLGLDAYAPTAWAAALEVGTPAAVTGGVIGGLLGAGRQLVVARRG